MNAPKNLARSTGRAVTGGGILLAAFALLMLLRHGPGASDKEGEDTPGSNAAEQNAESLSDSLILTNATETPGLSKSGSQTDAASLVQNRQDDRSLTADEKKALSGEVLTVVIDESTFLIEVPTGDTVNRLPRPLSRIVELARQTKGDSNGLRVRVVPLDSSRAQAEADLAAALGGADIGTSAIHMATPGEN